jgi:uncharacterized protein YgiM (DUF1202 family)
VEEPETTAPAPAGLTPTHTIPAKGLPARAEPDSKAKTTGRIDGGTEVEVVEESGLWAKVKAADGSEAWVNGRLLVALSAAEEPEAVEEPETTAPAPEATEEPAPAAAAWGATHTVPDGGLPAREKPDASLDPLLRIKTGTGIRVLETSGAWSRIDIESGWSAWVDNRRLIPTGETAPTQPEPVQEPEVWTATHAIPNGGLSAWAEPKADRQPIMKIKGGTRVRTLETRGAWARIGTAEGWVAWVDGRHLVDPG